MRHKRQILAVETIREHISQHAPYVPINNRIFDDLYEKESVVSLVDGKKQEVRFTELDFVVYVFLVFLQRSTFTLFTSEMAEYLTCSEKALRDSIAKLKSIRVGVNNRSGITKVPEIYSDQHEVFLLSEKMEYAYSEHGKSIRTKIWYPNFVSDRKDRDGEKASIKYFHVTIHDLDLLTTEKLTRKEFIFYLFIIRIDTNNNHKFYIRPSMIAERLGIKGYSTVLRYLEKLEQMGLIQLNKPQNYEAKLISRKEPSLEPVPIFNRKTLAELWAASEKVDSKKQEEDQHEWEDESENQEDEIRNKN